MHERLERIKNHIQEHRTTYIATAVTATVTGVTVYVVMKYRGPSVGSSVAVKQGIAVNSPVTISNVTNIIDRALGDSGDVIKNVNTGQIFRSRGELSRDTGFSMAAIGKYFKNEISDLGGDQYEIIDKAERLLHPQFA